MGFLPSFPHAPPRSRCMTVGIARVGGNQRDYEHLHNRPRGASRRCAAARSFGAAAALLRRRFARAGRRLHPRTPPRPRWGSDGALEQHLPDMVRRHHLHGWISVQRLVDNLLDLVAHPNSELYPAFDRVRPISAAHGRSAARMLGRFWIDDWARTVWYLCVSVAVAERRSLRAAP